MHQTFMIIIIIVNRIYTFGGRLDDKLLRYILLGGHKDSRKPACIRRRRGLHGEPNLVWLCPKKNLQIITAKKFSEIFNWNLQM